MKVRIAKITSILLVMFLLLAAGCQAETAAPVATEKPAEETAAPAVPTEAITEAITEAVTEAAKTGDANGDGVVNVAVSLADTTDYYIGTMVGQRVQKAFEDAGAKVQVLDAGNVVTNQQNQIQNAVTQGAEIIYVFPIGDATAYHDVLKAARDAGVKVMVSNNYPGEDAADVYVGSDEFLFGVQMAAMLSKWVDTTFPEAGPGEVPVLIVEASFNNNMIRRDLGMRLIAEKFLRQADVATIYYVKTEGGPVDYVDASGNVVAVDEPTGGLILDKDGHAILNPFYNAKVNLIEYANRNNTGIDATESQNAVDATIAQGYTDLKAVISYGDTGAALSSKLMDLSKAGVLDADLNKLAVFCSDLTDTNQQLILQSAKNESLLRGVMAAGDLIATLEENAKKLVNGEDVAAYTMEPLSYNMANADGTAIVTVLYTDEPQLPDTILFFPN